MDSYDPDQPEEWKNDTLATITFLQFQLGKVWESEVEEDKVAAKRYGHAMACLRRHYRCRTNCTPPSQVNDMVSKAEYFRLINVDKKLSEGIQDSETQTQIEVQSVMFIFHTESVYTTLI
jgi:hypothetical protein